MFCASEEGSTTTDSGSSSEGSSGGGSTTYTIGGSITGLSAAGLVLQNNSGDNLTVANGATSFTFATALSNGASYSVTVQTQPTGLSCGVTNATGTVSSANVTNVTVSCSSTKRIFVSATSYSGNLGGVSGADAKCQADGNKPSGGGTYKAMLSSGTARRACTSANCSGGTSEHADWVLLPNTKYVRSDGTTEIFTTNSNGIFEFGTLTNAISSGSGFVWTALNVNWTNNAQNCGNWSNTTGTNVIRGIPNSTVNSILATGTSNCDQTSPAVYLYCVEQ
ncbi:MAG: DUF1554 domain-containing protein [Leptospiraceae bacterium]|nr:DUF1554 domain-containing protein [Leptospiraceae bacterium]